MTTLLARLSAAFAWRRGRNWTPAVTVRRRHRPGDFAIGSSNTSAFAFGGRPSTHDLGVLFAEPLWSGCSTNVDPSYALQSYAFGPNPSGGLATFHFSGWDFGTIDTQALNVEPTSCLARRA